MTISYRESLIFEWERERETLKKESSEGGKLSQKTHYSFGIHKVLVNKMIVFLKEQLKLNIETEMKKRNYRLQEMVRMKILSFTNENGTIGFEEIVKRGVLFLEVLNVMFLNEKCVIVTTDSIIQRTILYPQLIAKEVIAEIKETILTIQLDLIIEKVVNVIEEWDDELEKERRDELMKVDMMNDVGQCGFLMELLVQLGCSLNFEQHFPDIDLNASGSDHHFEQENKYSIQSFVFEKEEPFQMNKILDTVKQSLPEEKVKLITDDIFSQLNHDYFFLWKSSDHLTQTEELRFQVIQYTINVISAVLIDILERNFNMKLPVESVETTPSQLGMTYHKQIVTEYNDLTSQLDKERLINEGLGFFEMTKKKAEEHDLNTLTKEIFQQDL